VDSSTSVLFHQLVFRKYKFYTNYPVPVPQNPRSKRALIYILYRETPMKYNEGRRNDSTALGCKVTCAALPNPHVDVGPINNSAAIAYWRDVASHSKSKGWWGRIFDYTCDEPGTGVGRYPVCQARATAIHAADPGYKVMTTAEKPSADSVNISSDIDMWAFFDQFRGHAGGVRLPSVGHR
jgi:hypothetical protein